MSEISGATFYAPLSKESLSVNGCTLTDGTVVFESMDIAGDYAGTVGEKFSVSTVNSTAAKVVIVDSTLPSAAKINNQGILVLDNVTYQYAAGENAHGANIDNDSGTLVIAGGEYSYNTISGTSGSNNSRGTVIYNDGGSVYITTREKVVDGKTVTVGALFAHNTGVSNAIWNTGGEVYINGATFLKNYSSTSGGAIYNNNKAVIADSFFYGNTATGHGGAIAFNGGTLEIYGSSFFSNESSKRGAINVEGSSSTELGTATTLIVKNSEFRDNIAGEGGAVNIRKGVAYISDTLFSGNICSQGALYVYGGYVATVSGNMQFLTSDDYIVCGTNATLNIIDATVTLNAKLSGSAAYINVQNSAFIFGNTTEISVSAMNMSGTNSFSFTGDAAVTFNQSFTGAVFLDADYTESMVVASGITDLTGYTAGNAVRQFDDVYLVGDNTRLQSATYINGATIYVNAADKVVVGGKESGFGKVNNFNEFEFIGDYAGKYVVSGNITLSSVVSVASGATVENNAVITIDGASILTDGKDNVKVFSINSENLSGTGSFAAKESGYHVYTADDGVYVATLTGAAIVSQNAADTLVNINGKFYGGDVYSDIAGAASSGASTIVVNDLSLVKDVITTYNNKTVILNNVGVADEEARKEIGGAIRHTYGNLAIYGGEFVNITGATNGGVIYSSKQIYIGKSGDAGTVFKGNIASGIGGAIYLNGCNAEIDGASFIDNIANGASAIYFYKGDSTVSNSYFSGNTAMKDGSYVKSGVLKTGGSPAYVTLTKNIFEKNKAQIGSVIYFENGTSLTSSNNIYRENESTSNGGAFSTKLTTSFSGDTFYKNKAGGNGGAIHSANTPVVTITGCTFTENRVASSKDGGAIYAQYQYTISDSVFDGNFAKRGGALYLYGGSTGCSVNLNGNVKFLTASDTIYLATGTDKNGTIHYSTLNITNAAITLNAALEAVEGCNVNVTNSTLIFGNTEEINIAGLTFSGSNTINLNGSALVNFTGLDVEQVAIKVNGELYRGEDLIVATGVTGTEGADDEVIGGVNLYLQVENGNLVLKQDAVTPAANDEKTIVHAGNGDGKDVAVQIKENTTYEGIVRAGSAEGTDGVVQTFVSNGSFVSTLYGGGLVSAEKTDLTISGAGVTVDRAVYGGKVGGQAVLGRQSWSATPWHTERHG